MTPVSPVLPNSPNITEIVLAKDQPQYEGVRFYLPLPVAHVQYSDGVQSMISRYRLTWRERVRILLSGDVWWEQLTFGGQLQPQKMYIEEPLKGCANG